MLREAPFLKDWFIGAYLVLAAGLWVEVLRGRLTGAFLETSVSIQPTSATEAADTRIQEAVTIKAYIINNLLH